MLSRRPMYYQVNLNSACVRRIPVFNAPCSNIRSVAELVIGEFVIGQRQKD